MDSELTGGGLSRRALLNQAGGLAAGGAVVMSLAKPRLARAGRTCSDSVQDIVNLLVAAEAIETTLYWAGITTPAVFDHIDEESQPYVQGALSSEKVHRDLLLSLGASLPQRKFFYPPNTLSGVEQFFAVLLSLEHGGLKAYAAAAARFGELGRSDLATLAARILGVEAEHRVLARDILGKTLPNDLCLEPQAFACVSNVAPALQPFLDGSNGQTAEIQMPSDMEIADAVGRFRCH